jgi:tripartite-type tricarboxylate transporter receptor subunit TctC
LPEVKKVLEGNSIAPIPGTAESFGAFIRQDTERWARVVKAGGISLQ